MIDVPVVQPPCPVINVNKFKVEAKSADCCTEDQCQSKFTITTNHTEPTCTEPGKCEFNVDLEITVPIPSVPCPEIKGKLKTTTGYVGAPCVTCINDITIQDKSKFEDLPAEDKPDGTYVGVENVSSLYTLAGDLKTWEPAGYEKPIFSLAELALLSPADRAGVTFVLQNPPTTYKKDDDGKWKPVVEPVADFTYSSVAERDAADSQTLPFSDRPLLRSTAAIPPGSVVKIDPPITYYRRKSVALWDKIRTRIEGVPSSVDRIVGSVAEMYNIPYSTSGSGSGLTVGAIVKVDLTPEPDGPITYYRRKSVAAWEKIRIKIEGVPSSVDRIVESTAEMYALPTGFGGVAVNGIVKVDETDVPASPVSYWRRQSVAVWEQIRTKIAGVPSSVDRIVESTAEMYALPTGSSGVNVGGIVKVDTTPVPPSPISYYRRKSVSLWEKINTKIEGVPSSVDQIVESVEEMQAIPYGNGGLWAGAIVKVDETDTAWQKQPDSTWQKIKNPMPTSVGGAAPTTTKINGAAVVSTPDIGPADAPVGSVTYVSSPPNQFVYEGGEWVPVIVPDDTITVYSEEDLDSIDTTERTAGMTVKVQKPTDRYLVVNGTLVPARCPESGFSVSSRKKKTEDCNEIPQCVFDLNLETLVQISKPPCPTINVTSFNVVTGFAGNEDDTQNVDETCLDCIVDETVETLEDAVTLALTAEPGTIIGINNPPTTYQLSNNLSTWEPTTTAAAITVADGAALTALLSDVNNGLQPGQKIHVTAPNSLYKISQDLKSWTPVNNNTAVPPTKLITVSTDADRDIIALSSRKKDMYVRVQNPTTDYTFTGSTIVPQTENENTVNTVADLDKIPENERAAGMFVTVLSPTDRVKVNDDHTISPANCPTNRFTITPRVIKGDDCNEPDKCEFDVDLQIAIPIPRVPCPIINVDNFQVNTHFTGGNNADDQACCIEGDTELVVTEVENNAARDALSFADVAIGGYAKTTDTGIFWRRTSDFKPDQWEAVADPTAAVCGSVFRVVPKHRTPENCQDPGQCEFDIELLINVPIPRTPCPEITTTTSVTVGYADSPCVACDTDMEVADLKELNAIPIADRTVGMRVKIKESITKYVRQNGEWVPGETDSTSTPADKTVANWGGVTLDDQVDGKIIDILDPPNQFLIGDGGEVNGKFRYSWEPLSDAGCEFDGPNNKTFTSTTTRDAYFANEYFGWHSACVTVINAPTRYTYKTEPIGGDNGLPIGWVGLSAGPATITVPSANDLPDEAADGTVVEVTNPTNRYKADDNKNWVADPCKTNSFIVILIWLSPFRGRHALSLTSIRLTLVP
ncbi:hypothetical protein EBZ39_00170 [bacterium]|nr:hypothetical protein [bacterium]